MLRAIKTPRKNIGDVAIGEFDRYCQVIDNHFEVHAPQLVKPTPLEVLLLIAGDDSWCDMKDAAFPAASETISSRSLRPIKVFASQMHKIRIFASTATVERLLTYIIDEMQLINHFDTISKTKTEFHEREANVQELRIAAERYDPNGPCLVEAKQQTSDGQEVVAFDEDTLSPLGKFLDDVTLVSDSVDDDSESEKFVVNFMTIHASKGMEFDSVYLVGMEDGTIPTSQVS
jgi:superfamily I DNA/RNA helicase